MDHYYQRSDMNHIEQDWQQYKIDYQRQKNIEKDKVNPEIEHLREKKARLEKNLAALELVKPKDLTVADIHVDKKNFAVLKFRRLKL